MRKALLAASALLTSSPALANDWWWIGVNGPQPNRVVTYVDLSTKAAIDRDTIQVSTLAVAETPLMNGQAFQLTQYGLRCSSRMISQRDKIAYDAKGAELPLAKQPPAGFTKVVVGSIGESVLNLACGTPAGFELQVASPAEHVASILTRPGSLAPGDQKAAEPSLSVGTGFFVDPKGSVLTSFHVVDGASRISCRASDGKLYPATLKRASMANDLALLDVATRSKAYLGLAGPRSIKSGDKVFTIGFGAVNFLGMSEPRFTEGSVSALSGVGAEDAYMQITVPVQPGNSGGPLVNEQGFVVGVIAAQAAVDAFVKAEGTLPQSINWAVKAEYALPLVGKKPRGMVRDRSGAIANARNSLCLIVVERDGG